MKEQKSEELFARAVKVMPGGDRSLDFIGTRTPLAHGHAAPMIVAVMRHAESEGAVEVWREVE